MVVLASGFPYMVGARATSFHFDGRHPLQFSWGCLSVCLSVCLCLCACVCVCVCVCVVTLILTVTVSPKGACVGERMAELSAMRTQDVVATAAQRVH